MSTFSRPYSRRACGGVAAVHVCSSDLGALVPASVAIGATCPTSRDPIRTKRTGAPPTVSALPTSALSSPPRWPSGATCQRPRRIERTCGGATDHVCATDLGASSLLGGHRSSSSIRRPGPTSPRIPTSRGSRAMPRSSLVFDLLRRDGVVYVQVRGTHATHATRTGVNGSPTINFLYRSVGSSLAAECAHRPPDESRSGSASSRSPEDPRSPSRAFVSTRAASARFIRPPNTRHIIAGAIRSMTPRRT